MNDGNAACPQSDPTPAKRVSEMPRTTFDWPRHVGATEAVLQELQVQLRLRRRRRNRLRAVGAAVVMMLAVGWLWQIPAGAPSVAPALATATVPARQVMPDGSVVYLRAGAEVSVDFSATIRLVRLDKGEALFEVAKNPERPFVVRAAGVDVRAVGTAFTVNRQNLAVEVLVTEGQVAVLEFRNDRPRDAGAADASVAEVADARVNRDPVQRSLRPSAPEWRLDAGNRIVVELAAGAPVPQVVAISAAEMEERIRWSVPTLTFARTPLSEGIALINQYSRTRLVLDSAALGSLPLSGAIRADNIAALLELLESEYGITAERRDEMNIVLRKAP